jgi:7-keto-8-aminopelargonate synthetase-like enzyme
VRQHPDVHAKLARNRATLREMLNCLGLSIIETPSPIATFERGSPTAMKAVQAALWREGIFVIYSTYVGAGPNGALRIAAFADHTERDFVRLRQALERELTVAHADA